VNLRPARVDEAAALAMMHRAVFEEPWGEAEIAALLDSPGSFALVADSNGPAGFILCRTMADEAEILTLAVAPVARRLGFGMALAQEAARLAAERGAASFFLEVAEDNRPAIALYETAGFEVIGRRTRYYGGVTDALVMRRWLNTQP
jgi:ribosomal-protein-alanine N-acetyltransferase